MNTLQLRGKLSGERLSLFLESPIWLGSAERGMSWREAVTDSAEIQAAIERMSSYAKQTISTMLQQFGAEPVPEERLLNALREQTSMAGAECRIGLRQLESAGILFAVRKMWGERLYFIPADCFLPWQQALFPCPLEEKFAIVSPVTDSEGAFLGVQEPFGRRLLYVLSALLKSDTSFTAKGVLHKKTIQKLDTALQIQEEKLRAFSMNWAHSEHYSAAAALALSACSAEGLLIKKEGQLITDEKGLRDWLLLSDEEREEQLLKWLLDYLFRCTGQDSHIAGILLYADKEKWYSVQDAESWCSHLLSSDNNQTMTMRRRLERWIGLFHEMGWMELAEMEEGQERFQVFRWRSFAGVTAEEGLIVQPNGEILALPDCGHLVRWELELIAERLTADEPVLYRMTSASIAAALELGRSRDSIERFLKEAGIEDALSSQISAMLKEWTSKACRFSFDQVTLLRCDSVEMAEHALKVTELATLLLQRIGDKDFIVDSQAVGKIRSLLQKSGYPPRKAVGNAVESGSAAYPFIPLNQIDKDDNRSEIAVPDDYSPPEVGRGWLYEPLSLLHFELIEQDGGTYQVELLPGIERVPAAWWRQLRSYHASTRKELMQQAVTLETAVQLRLHGELKSFVPEQVEGRGNEWSVTGRLIAGDTPERSRLTPDMWDEMKLLLPDGFTT